MNLKNLIFLSLLTSILCLNKNEVYGQNRLKFQNTQNPQTSLAPNNKSTNNNSKKIDLLAEKIVKTLELNPLDAKIIYSYCEERAEKIDKIKLNSDNSQQKIADLQAVNQNFDLKIKQLVSPGQYQKYEVMKRSGH
jgi:hypothetical protein